MKPLTPSKRHRSRIRAFTLIELMVVVLILAILAALVVPRFFEKADQAKVAKAQSDLSDIAKTLEFFRLDTGRYPTTEEGLNALYADPGNVEGWKQEMTKPIPPDPWQHPYTYVYPGAGGESTYTLESLGADGQQGGDGLNADIIESP